MGAMVSMGAAAHLEVTRRTNVAARLEDRPVATAPAERTRSALQTR